MPGKLDQISEAIGALRASVAAIHSDIAEINRRMDQLCRNGCPALRQTSVRIDEHAALIDAMRPTLTALESSRAKLALWASIGFAAVVLLGWIVEAAFKWAVAWMLSHFQ
jgi:hypothetical protein